VSAKPQEGGVVFRAVGAGALFFLPATIAMKVLPVPEVARIPGAPADLVGVALVEGDMIPIIALDEAHSFGAAMLLCNCMGERLGLVGLEVVATGRFDLDGGGKGDDVTHHDETARLFDVASVIARVREGRWAV